MPRSRSSQVASCWSPRWFRASKRRHRGNHDRRARSHAPLSALLGANVRIWPRDSFVARQLPARPAGHEIGHRHSLCSLSRHLSTTKWECIRKTRQGQPIYNWSYVDQIYDGLLENGVRPFVEMSFMPRALAASDKPSRVLVPPVTFASQETMRSGKNWFTTSPSIWWIATA